MFNTREDPSMAAPRVKVELPQRAAGIGGRPHGLITSKAYSTLWGLEWRSWISRAAITPPRNFGQIFGLSFLIRQR